MLQYIGINPHMDFKFNLTYAFHIYLFLQCVSLSMIYGRSNHEQLGKGAILFSFINLLLFSFFRRGGRCIKSSVLNQNDL